MNEHKQSRTSIDTLTLVWFFLTLFLFVTFLVYVLPPANPVAKAATRIIPYPVMRVNGMLVPYREYLARRKGLQTAGVEMNQLGEDLLLKMARERIIKKELRVRDKLPSKQDTQNHMETVVNELGGSDDFTAWLQETYGWRPGQYQVFVAEPYLQAKAFQTYVLTAREPQHDLRNQVEAVRQRWVDGETFDSLVLEFSDDESRVVNGDYGWNVVSTLPEDWQQPAANLPLEDMSPVIEGPRRFTLMVVNDRRERNEELQANISVITKNKLSATEYIEQELAEAKIVFFGGF